MSPSRSGAAAEASAGQPLADSLDDILTCVHCGFCLPACPTYEVLGDENDAPRGRIYLMRAVAEGRLAPDDPAFTLHIDQCLGCRACEPVCPSGVRYGHLLERAREVRTAAAGGADGLMGRLLDLVFPRPWLQNLIWFALRLLRATGLPHLFARLGGRRPGRLRFALAMLAATAPRRFGDGRAGATDFARARGPDRAGTGPSAPTAALLEGCIMSGLLQHVNAATERVVRVHGAETSPLPRGLCCGALQAHSGSLERAREMARRLVRAFEASDAEILLTNSAGCGAALKEYGEWLADDPDYAQRGQALADATYDVTEWLAERPETAYAPLPLRVAYDAPCHLLHAQGVDDGPLELLQRIPKLEVRRLARADRCCGAAGTYGITQRDLSQDLLDRKLAEIAEVTADVVVTGNPGCLMQIGAGAVLGRGTPPAVHPVELMDKAVRR